MALNARKFVINKEETSRNEDAVLQILGMLWTEPLYLNFNIASFILYLELSHQQYTFLFRHYLFSMNSILFLIFLVAFPFQYLPNSLNIFARPAELLHSYVNSFIILSDMLFLICLNVVPEIMPQDVTSNDCWQLKPVGDTC